MKKLIVNYNLEILTIILALVFGVSLFFWNNLTLAGKALLGFMVLYTLHEWEESRFPRGFYDLFFGLFEGVIHVAGIKIHRLKKPYTSGMITGIIMFVYSVFIITQINRAGGLPIWQWIIGFILAFVGFIVMEQFFLRTIGLTFGNFRKMAMNRVLGNRK